MTDGPQMEVGLIGLGTMGRALAESLARSGFAVHAADPLETNPAPVDGVTLHGDPAALAAALTPPRRILIMVTAGDPVDSVIGTIGPHCVAGDFLVDGGNSFFRDTERREAALSEAGIGFVGAGISGGEEGARHGASVMAGGTKEACAAAGDILTALAARHDGAPCHARVGPGGAGHFVKMVHNGIEYALMQAIAEAHFLLHRGAGLPHDAIAGVFREWAGGPLDSYLLDIAADVLETSDVDSFLPLLEALDDRAYESGTGRWVVSEAMALGMPVPSIAEAVFARNVSAQADIRAALSVEHDGAVFKPTDRIVGDVRSALTCTALSAFAQGFSVLSAAGARDGWEPDLAAIAGIWRKGCIIQGRMVETARAAYLRRPDLPHLLVDREVAALMFEHAHGWRETAARAIESGVPVPVTAASLGWYDALHAGRLWTALVQAQRDYFGRHGLRRTDRDGVFHADWKRGGTAT